MLKGRVGYMRTIPRQQIVHSVDSRDGNMQSVNFRLFRKRNLFDQLLGEVFGLFGYVENGNVVEKIKALLSGLRITGTAFGDYSLRDENIVFVTVLVPPIVR
jgi:hypothetical protein